MQDNATWHFTTSYFFLSLSLQFCICLSLDILIVFTNHSKIFFLCFLLICCLVGFSVSLSVNVLLSKGSFINDVTQIWTIFDPPPPPVKLLCTMLYVLLSHNHNPSPSLHDVIYKCSLFIHLVPVSESNKTKMTKMTVWGSTFFSGKCYLLKRNKTNRLLSLTWRKILET